MSNLIARKILSNEKNEFEIPKNEFEIPIDNKNQYNEKKDSLTKLERTRDTYESELKTLNKKIKDLGLAESDSELINNIDKVDLTDYIEPEE